MLPDCNQNKLQCANIRVDEKHLQNRNSKSNLISKEV